MAVVGTAEIDVVAKTNKFEQQITNSSGIAAKALSKFNGAIDNVDKRLQSFGFTSRDVSILMGAGLAGGVAFAAREIVAFGAAAVEASSALHEQQSATDSLFQSSSAIVEVFAEGASAMGLSERAALQAANAFGGLFTNIGLPLDAAAHLSVGLTALASDLASFKDISVDDALQKLRSGLVGETEALRSLDIIIDESTVKQKALEIGLGEVGRELTQGEKILARYQLILDLTGNSQGDMARTADSLANAQRRANAEWENAKAALGDALRPAVTAVTQALADQLEALNALNDGYVNATTSVTLFGIGFRKSIDGKETNAFRKLLDIINGFDETADDAADSADELAAATDELNDPVNKAAVALQKATEETNKMADAQKRLDRALADSERRVDRAEETLARAFEDAELRVDKSERRLGEAYEDRAEKIADAEEKVAETRLDGQKDIRSAAERLRDFEIDAARRLADAERRLTEARRERARAITAGVLAIQQAQAAGDAEAENAARRALAETKQSTDVADAERALARERADTIREQAKLERDLLEARIEANKRLREAQENLAKVFKETAKDILEAQRDLQDAQRTSARQIADAQRGLADAQREGAEAVEDAQTAMSRLADDAKRAADNVHELNEELLELSTHAQGGLIGEDIVGLSHHAHGGPFSAGDLSIVGEQGPELVRFGGSGSVVSNPDFIRLLLEWFRRMMDPDGLPQRPIGNDPLGPRFNGEAKLGNVTVVVPHQDPRVLANELAFTLARLVN